MVRFVATSAVFICFALPTQVGAQLLFFGRKPTVKTVTAKQVRQLLDRQTSAEAKALAENKDNPRADFVLVDVRSAEEQAVSMIPGAITAKQFEKHRKDHQGQTAIAYCTIGVRSEKYARKLIASGQAAVNFKGSILGWCEAKFSLVTPDGKPTQRVHTYSARFKVPSEYTAVH